jgi:hypothetical protein
LKVHDFIFVSKQAFVDMLQDEIQHRVLSTWDSCSLYLGSSRVLRIAKDGLGDLEIHIAEIVQEEWIDSSRGLRELVLLHAPVPHPIFRLKNEGGVAIRNNIVPLMVKRETSWNAAQCDLRFLKDSAM